MSRASLALLIAAATAFTASSADATITVFQAQLTGTQEVPPDVSPALGLGTVTIDDNALTPTMRVQLTFSGLISPTTSSHIHCCAPPGDTDMVATPIPSFSGFPLGVFSGTMDQTFDMTLPASYNTAFITAHGGTTASAFADLLTNMIAGNAYFDIHTAQLPGGEIRGQLEAPSVPESGTWVMMLLGFGALGAVMRRSRRRPIVIG